MNGAPLLPTIKARSWEPEWLPEGWVAGERYTSASVTAPFEVVVAHALAAPRVADATRVWKGRHGGRALDVLLAVIHGSTALVVGISDASHRGSVPLSRVAACCSDAMTATQPTALRSALAPLFAEEPTAAEGLTNKGLFATHALTTFGQRHPDAWAAAVERARGVRERSGTDVLTHLGWSVGMHGDAYVLRTDDEAHAVAVLLEGDEVFDRPSLRFGLGTSPVEHALALAAKQKVAWVQAVQGKRIRLYPVPHDLGVRRTGVTSYTEINLARLGDDELGYVGLLLSPEALRDGGTAFQIVEESRIRATELGARLRERIYVDVVPSLAEAVARRMTPAGEALDERGLSDAYHRTLVILFRTLFVAYAEDRDLLPLVGPHAAGYDRVALKNRASEWARSVPTFSHTATDLWDDLRAIWSAVHDGSTEWGIPAYGGSIFDDTLEDRLTLAGLTLTNAEIGPALLAMLVDKDIDDEPGPVDFGALSVREFGTIYEGLLESSLSTAPVDLTIDKNSVYVPAKKGESVVIRGGEVYFHNASGARKATGSYFTKEFAVSHLLSTALAPALDEHLSLVKKLMDSDRAADASQKFFDFRVADIAMGSGHFLVGALDVIAERMSRFLTENPLHPVADELESLRSQATESLASVGRDADAVTLSQESLLRRQIAKRCLYGVDINEIAVDLSRLALWIHTFVPGLPMSSLDYHLIQGNSLTGIATTAELLEVLEPGVANATAAGGFAQSFFRDEIIEGQREGSSGMRRAALLSEATVAQAAEAAILRSEAEETLKPVVAVYDAAFAGRLRKAIPEADLPEIRITAASGWDALVDAGSHPAVRALVADLDPVHFPVRFPEVFERELPGFDVLLGNPPWQEVTVEEDKFWGMHDPHLRATASADSASRINSLRKSRPDLVAQLTASIRAAAEMRRALLAGQFPGMETGDPDLYKAFVWQFTRLARREGRIGIITPRSLYTTKGSAPWRKDTLTQSSTDIIFVFNEAEWMFTDVNPGWGIALTTMRTCSDNATLRTGGPFRDFDSFVDSRDSLSQISLSRLAEVDPQLCVPTLDGAASLQLFSQLIRNPSLGGDREDFCLRPHTDLHASNDGRDRFFTNDNMDHPVYNHTNIGHLVFDSAAGPFNFVRFEEVVDELFRRRLATYRRSNSPFFGISKQQAETRDSLPVLNPRIAFRDVVHSGNSRKSWAALLPARTVLTNKAPYLIFTKGDLCTQSYVLGMLSSSTCDWFAHLRVGLNMNFFILNSLPVPVYQPDDSRFSRLSMLAGRLALGVEGDYGAWSSFGDPVVDTAERAALIAEADAISALLYGVPRSLLGEIFHDDSRPELTTVLDHFDRWSDQ